MRSALDLAEILGINQWRGKTAGGFLNDVLALAVTIEQKGACSGAKKDPLHMFESTVSCSNNVCRTKTAGW